MKKLFKKIIKSENQIKNGKFTKVKTTMSNKEIDRFLIDGRVKF